MIQTLSTFARRQYFWLVMVLYLVGLGLGDEHDITVRGLEVVKTCKRVVLESYTSILPGIDKERLEQLYGKDVEIAYREKVEEDIEEVSERFAWSWTCLRDCPV